MQAYPDTNLGGPTYPGGLSRRDVVAWRNGLFTIFGMLGLGLASWMARTPAIKAALDITTAQMGLLLFSIALGSIIGLALASHIIARVETRAVMFASYIVAPIGLTIAGLGVTIGQQFWVVFFGLAVFGFAVSSCDVAMNLSGAVNERVLGRTTMPVFHAFFSFGTIIGAGLGAVAELLKLPLAVHIGILAAVMMVAGLAAVRNTRSEHILREHHGGAESGDGGWRGRLAIWRDPRTLFIGLIVLGMAFAEGSANDWLPLASVEGHGVSRAGGAIVFGVFMTAMTVGRLAGVKLLDRYGRVTVLRASAALAVVGLLMFIFIPVLWLAICGVVFWGLGSALGFPTGMSAAADDPRIAAARVSAVATIGYCAFLIGPPAIGFLGEHFGLLHALLIVVVLIVVAGFASGAARNPEVSERI